MYKYPVIIPSLATGIVLTLAFCIPATAQDKKPMEKVQIKILENGKVKTDTSFAVDYNVNPKDLDVMIKNLVNEKEDQTAEEPGKGKKHRKEDADRRQARCRSRSARHRNARASAARRRATLRN